VQESCQRTLKVSTRQAGSNLLIAREAFNKGRSQRNPIFADGKMGFLSPTGD